jgi:oxygen-independent coproporphyrinogen-3 oxidase
MHPSTISEIIDKIRGLWPMVNDPEITLEANPSSVEAEKFKGFAQAGINRVSMGIQALDDADLKRLGRVHTLAQAQNAFDIARHEFDRVSFDLIYGRQDQTVGAWEKELRQALAMAIDHLSLYQLTIEQGTAFGDRYNAGKLRGLPSDDIAADMYEVTQDICNEAGFPSYEVSNHARSDAESRHNLIYWRYGDYIGLGPGAHGRITINGKRFATEHARNPQRWLGLVSEGKAETVRELLDLRDQANEYLMMGLRINEGINLDRFQTLAKSPLDSEKVKTLKSHGFVEIDGQFLKTTPAGRRILNTVLSELIL